MVVNGGLSTTPKTRQAALYYVSVFILWNQRNKCSLCLKQRDNRRVKRSERTKIKLNFAGFAIVAFQRLLKFIQSGTWRCSRVPAGIRWSYGGEPRCGWYKGTFKNSKTSLPPTVASSKAVTANSIVVSTIWWQRTGVGCILKSDVYGGSPVYDALLVWHSEFWVTHFYQMRWFRVRFEMPRCWQCSAILLKWGIFTVKWGGGIFTEIIFTVNMPPLKNSLTKTGKTMLFFYIWNATFSVTSINSQIYMTMPKQAPKKLSENTGTTFSVIMPPFSSRGGA